MKKLFLFMILSVFGMQTFPQTEEENPYPSYYNKKKGDSIQDYKNILSTDIPSIISGEFPVIWEHNFSKWFQTGLGIGVLAPYFVRDDMIFPITSSFSNNKWGYSAYAAISLLMEFPLSFHISPYGHFRSYSTVNVFDCGIRIGYKFPLGIANLFMDFGGYSGIIFQKTKDGFTEFFTDYYNPFSSEKYAEVFGLSLKIGYVFKNKPL